MRRNLIVVALLFFGGSIFPLARGNRADLIVTAAHVVTMDSEYRLYEPGAVVIRGDTIAAVGPRAEILKNYTARDIHHAGERWVLPGLVNTHTHIPMNLMRGLGDDLELMSWLRKYIFPLEAKVVDAEYVYEATLAGCAEMIRRGTTTAADMYYFEDEVARGVKESGLRGFLGETIIGFPAPDFKTPEETLAYTERCIQKWAADPLVRVVPAPHSVYTVEPDILKRCKELADRTGSLMITHLAESEGEVVTVQQKYAKSPVQHAADLGILGPHVLAAHCVQLTAADLDTLQRSGAAVAHNPDSNLKLASGLAPVVEMLRRGIRVGLGTDGAVSNNRLDLFHAMDLAAKIHKIREKDATVMKARDVVKMATLGGAETLGAGSSIGSLESGKKADLIVINLTGPSYEPVYNIYSHLVYVAHGEAVESTMVAGRWLMKDRKLLSLSPVRLERILQKYQQKIQAVLGPPVVN